MNDIKTSERARLGQRNLAALMWYYHTATHANSK